jgi:hypothetical protein
VTVVLCLGWSFLFLGLFKENFLFDTISNRVIAESKTCMKNIIVFQCWGKHPHSQDESNQSLKWCNLKASP